MYPRLDGASPSGKAAVFGTAIPRFESWRPSHRAPPFCGGAEHRDLWGPAATYRTYVASLAKIRRALTQNPRAIPLVSLDRTGNFQVWRELHPETGSFRLHENIREFEFAPPAKRDGTTECTLLID
jgi:hypothetical protein